jgi:UDP-glucose-4-epimerase GalE
MNPAILVTGGAGYVGSHACKALARAGFAPVTYDNLSTGNAWAVKWGPLEQGDILDASRIREVMQLYQPVAVMHFAASALVGESMRSPGLYYRNNAAGTLTLLEGMRASNIAVIVFSSTCAVYGVPSKSPIDEDLPKKPVNPYGHSKLMAEQMLADYDAAHGLRHVALRYFNAAGADPEGEIGEARAIETHLVPLVLDSILHSGPAMTILGGDYPTADGTAVRDYIHVADLAHAHVVALRYLLGGGRSLQLNLGTGRGSSVRDVMACVERVTGQPIKASVTARRPGDPPTLVANPALAQQKLGLDFAASSSLDTIITSAWAWHRRKHELLI